MIPVSQDSSSPAAAEPEAAASSSSASSSSAIPPAISTNTVDIPFMIALPAQNLPGRFSPIVADIKDPVIVRKGKDGNILILDNYNADIASLRIVLDYLDRHDKSKK